MSLIGEIRQARERRDDADRKHEHAAERVEWLRDQIEESERDVARWKERRHEIRDEIEREIARDERDRGEHKPEWELKKRERRDELADLIEAEETRIDALIMRLEERKEDREKWADLRRRMQGRIDRLRERRRRIREERSGQLTEHFHVEEFRCRDGTPVPNAAIDALRDNCRRYLEPARARFGAIGITSGYRTRSYNESIGGASNSVHIYDAHPAATAVDHVSAGDAAGTVQRFHDAETHPDGMGYYSGFTHVDNRNRIGWPDARWSGAG